MTALNICILMYHGIDSDSQPYRSRCADELEWVLSRDTFNKQMEILKLRGFQPVTLDELLLLQRSGRTPRKPIILTFDDGHESNYYNAFPVLNQYGFKAEFFITTDWIDTDNYMSSAQLIELHNAGMSIQSHARSHRFLTDLGNDELLDELRNSREKLSCLLGRDACKYISYPGGRHDSRTESCARDVGFLGSFTSVRGYNTTLNSLFGLKRQVLTKDTTERHFKALVENNYLYFTIKKTISILINKMIRRTGIYT